MGPDWKQPRAHWVLEGKVPSVIPCREKSLSITEMGKSWWEKEKRCSRCWGSEEEEERGGGWREWFENSENWVLVRRKGGRKEQEQKGGRDHGGTEGNGWWEKNHK